MKNITSIIFFITNNEVNFVHGFLGFFVIICYHLGFFNIIAVNKVIVMICLLPFMQALVRL